jgi:multidrug efflux pump subunit AcrB
MMTTFAALFAALPLIFGGGMGLNCASRWASPLPGA